VKEERRKEERRKEERGKEKRSGKEKKRGAEKELEERKLNGMRGKDGKGCGDGGRQFNVRHGMCVVLAVNLTYLHPIASSSLNTVSFCFSYTGLDLNKRISQTDFKINYR
jgi:hypothetical protein